VQFQTCLYFSRHEENTKDWIPVFTGMTSNYILLSLDIWDRNN
jgi:hypothetical protein